MDARDALEEDQEAELVADAVVVVVAVEAAITLSRPREIAHLERREPKLMVMVRKLMEMQVMEETREEGIVEDVAVAKAKKKLKMIERTTENKNTQEEMELENREEDVHKLQAQTNRTLMMLTRVVVEDVAVEEVAEEAATIDTAVIDRTIELEEIDPVEDRETIEEAMMVNPVNLVQTTEADAVADLQSKVSHNAKTVPSVVEEVMASAAAEVAPAVAATAVAVEEAVPLTEKETTEVVDSVV